MANLPKIKRAVVLIGVQKPKSMQPLQAVWQGVSEMAEWAATQMDRDDRQDLIVKITDENEDVYPRRIKKPIDQLVERGDIEQLIVYFSGHGVIKGFNEYWMLSDGMNDPDASVNLTLSVELARRCTIPHVTFISDACRTPVATVQAHRIMGSAIFPSTQIGGQEKSVDQFYATVLGDPALEIQQVDAVRYRPVFTTAMLEALRGQHPSVLESNQGVSFVRPRPLKKFLTNHLPMRVMQELGVGGANQTPDARITSNPEVWLSALKVTTRSLAPTHTMPEETVETLGAAARQMNDITSFQANTTRAAFAGKDIDLNQLVREAKTLTPVPGSGLAAVSRMNQQFSEQVNRNAESFGPDKVDTDCGFKTYGANVVSCFTDNVKFAIHDQGKLISVEVPPHSVASVLLELSSGNGLLLPAIGGFLATLKFDGDSLVDVGYEPAEGTDRYGAYESRSDEIRGLRAIVASSSRMGTFQLDEPDANNLARRMQIAKGIDPSLALYAAHAYREQGDRQRIKEMADYMRRDLGFIPFDIALFAGKKMSFSTVGGSPSEIAPCLPLFTQTWALLPAYDVQFPDGLADISRHVLPNSLWTAFDADGVSLISEAIEKGMEE